MSNRHFFNYIHLTFKRNTTHKHLSVDINAVIIAEPPIATHIMYVSIEVIIFSIEIMFNPLRKIL